MTPSAARLSVAFAIVRRQVWADATDAQARAWLKVCRVPALFRWDDGTVEPTAAAGPVLMERTIADALDLPA